MIDPSLKPVPPFDHYRINTMPDSNWLDLLDHGYGYFERTGMRRNLTTQIAPDLSVKDVLTATDIWDEVFNKSVELAKNFEKTGGFMTKIPMIKKIIFSGPCTIILWADGTKTMARCSEDDIPKYSPEVGFAMAFMKKIFTRSGFKSIIREKGVMNSK